LLLLLALSTTQACRYSQEPEPLSLQETCDEVGFALASRAVACGSTAEQGNQRFEEFTWNFVCNEAAGFESILGCSAAVLQAPCEVAPIQGRSLQATLEALPICIGAVRLRDGTPLLPPCENGGTRCGEECVYLDGDPRHCGACGNACPSDEARMKRGVCEQGSCTFHCIAPFADCDGDPDNGCEVDLFASIGDVNHCGRCGNACQKPTAPGLQVQCLNSACVVTCEPSLLDCDGDPKNGCETAVGPENCFACGETCFFNGVVIARCNLDRRACETLQPCPVFQLNCDGDPENGCETPMSAENCGRCGAACPTFPHAISRCVSPGFCQHQCAPGFLDCNKTFDDGCEVEAEKCP
jgi:hypothetical protein